MEISMEDDVFFAELNKQISLLIMDDDEELIHHSPSISFEAFSQPIHQAPRPQYLLEQPTHRRECKGTGVFIPRSTNTRKKNKQERCNSNKHFNNSRSAPHHVTYNSNNNNVSYYNIDSFNSRRI